MVSPRSSCGPERPDTIRRIQGTVLETWTVKKGIREWSEMEENGTLSHLDFAVLESMRLLFQRFYLFIKKRGREGEREGEKHQCVVASRAPTTGSLARNPGMCPDWESNWRPFGSQPMLNPQSHPSQGMESMRLLQIYGLYCKNIVKFGISKILKFIKHFKTHLV